MGLMSIECGDPHAQITAATVAAAAAAARNHFILDLRRQAADVAPVARAEKHAAYQGRQPLRASAVGTRVPTHAARRISRVLALVRPQAKRPGERAAVTSGPVLGLLLADPLRFAGTEALQHCFAQEVRRQQALR